MVPEIVPLKKAIKITNMDMIPATSLVLSTKVEINRAKETDNTTHKKVISRIFGMESPQKTPKSFDNNKMYISATDIIENTNPVK